MEKSRLFWVVDSHEDNEEIFATKSEALKYAEKYGKQEPYRIFIAEVRNYFREVNGSWNYDDRADTFDHIITVVMQNDTRPVEA